MLMAKNYRIHSELMEELEWLAARARHGIKGPPVYDDRLYGPWADCMINWYITEELIEPPYGPHPADMVSVLNLYSIAPPHVQKSLEDLVSEWKLRCWGDADVPVEPSKEVSDFAQRPPPESTYHPKDIHDSMSMYMSEYHAEMMGCVWHG